MLFCFPLEDPVSFEMPKSVHGIGHVMEAHQIAEFVENEETFQQISEIDIDYAQGYWNEHPEPWIP